MCSAITRGDIVTLRNLLRCNADPNSLDYDKRAPLHIAAADGNLQAVGWRVHRRICNAQAPRGGGGVSMELGAWRVLIALLLQSRVVCSTGEVGWQGGMQAQPPRRRQSGCCCTSQRQTETCRQGVIRCRGCLCCCPKMWIIQALQGAGRITSGISWG
jgi:hypothetical protein